VAGTGPVVTDPKARRNRVICDGARVPTGWVVIGSCHSAACPGDGLNALVVKRPGRLEVVADASPVPEGWRRTRRTHSDSFEGDGDNAWVIEREPTAGG